MGKQRHMQKSFVLTFLQVIVIVTWQGNNLPNDVLYMSCFCGRQCLCKTITWSEVSSLRFSQWPLLTRCPFLLFVSAQYWRLQAILKRQATEVTCANLARVESPFTTCLSLHSAQAISDLRPVHTLVSLCFFPAPNPKSSFARRGRSKRACMRALGVHSWSLCRQRRLVRLCPTCLWGEPPLVCVTARPALASPVLHGVIDVSRMLANKSSSRGQQHPTSDESLDGPNRQSPIASVRRTRSTLTGHCAIPYGKNVTWMNANRAIRISGKERRVYED